MLQKIIWSLLILLLPITSMPFVKKIVRSDTVASPAILLLGILVVIWLIPFIWKEGRLPKLTLPLLFFAGAASVSSLLSFFREVPVYKENSVLIESGSALVTLLIGLLFYLVTITFLRTQDLSETTLRLVSIAGMVVIAWSLLQMISWVSMNRYPNWMKFIHDLYSVGPLYRQRVSGFALEPSWLAHQLNVLFLPYWLGSSLAGYSVFRKKFGPFTAENILLVLGVLILVLTSSRIGLLAFPFMALIAVAKIIQPHWRQVQVKLSSAETLGKKPRWKKPLMNIAVVLLSLLLLAGILAGLAFLVSKLDYRMREFFVFDFNHQDAILDYAEKISLAPRLVYFLTGFSIFSHFPWIGVGLGNSGFYFPQYLEPYGWRLPEVQGLIYRGTSLLNIKSLWIRLLAETGIVGFSLFFAWFVEVLFFIKKLFTSDEPMIKTLAWMGLFSAIGMFFDGFSLDSFALPYTWIAFGIVGSLFAWEKQLFNEMKLNREPMRKYIGDTELNEVFE